MPSIFDTGRKGEVSQDEYDRVSDEESKPLHHDSDSDHGHDHQTTAEMYALNRSIQKTNLYLKIIIGLLAVTVFALLFLQSPATYKTYKELKNPKRIIKSPVPESRMQAPFPTYMSDMLQFPW
jgi:hypothetical protein